MTKYQNSIDSRLLSMMSMVECVTLPLFLFVNTLLENKRSVEYIMGEVMICRGGRGSGSGGGTGNLKLVAETIYENTNWTVPEGIVNGEVSVRIFGGGGGGTWYHVNSKISSVAGGGSGWMNNDILKLRSGEVINIIIGSGGLSYLISEYSGDYNNVYKRSSGGVTSFGTYLSANGGQGSICTGKNYTSLSGGNGGSGGSGYVLGGTGYQFGGGSSYNGNAGNGGPWGGGGGSIYGNGGKGGIYGGGGATYANTAAKGGTYGGDSGNNGTNTMLFSTSINEYNTSYIRGNGTTGYRGNIQYGGGGYGGSSFTEYGGGGGYGGNSGLTSSNAATGGGGYGSDSPNAVEDRWGCSGSGGGGYLFTIDSFYPGGVGLGIFGAGGTGVDLYSTGFESNGRSGICIIQYYTYQ